MDIAGRSQVLFRILYVRFVHDLQPGTILKGQKIGTKSALELISKMLEAGDSLETIKNLSEDENFFEEMKSKYLSAKE